MFFRKYWPLFAAGLLALAVGLIAGLAPFGPLATAIQALAFGFGALGAAAVPVAAALVAVAAATVTLAASLLFIGAVALIVKGIQMIAARASATSTSEDSHPSNSIILEDRSVKANGLHNQATPLLDIQANEESEEEEEEVKQPVVEEPSSPVKPVPLVVTQTEEVIALEESSNVNAKQPSPKVVVQQQQEPKEDTQTLVQQVEKQPVEEAIQLQSILRTGVAMFQVSKEQQSQEQQPKHDISMNMNNSQ
ncbi:MULTISPECIES: hypothetical protein [Legionella]|uniref:hypothetical protein n=1 Tax=Legionella TaxID=445 RepID=UPI000F8CC9A7|nr:MULTISPECIES: hypothetical protein [Legionella]MCP0914851.1 hypothetical protein [Legionella sp. 27cVA30]RUR02916.1 hypothetical protein ELY11_00740 [Legionella septentrionalis]